MAPTRARAKPSKSSGSKSHKPGSSGSGGRSKSSSSSSSGKSSSRVSKPKSKSSSKLITGREIRAIPSSLSKTNKRKQRRVYTDKELGIKPLNKITPVGVRKPTSGKKKGKVYIDDAESMRRIFALVRAEKDKDVEGKVQRERQLEEVREARRIEMEKKEDARKAKLEETKDALRKPRKKSISDSNKSIEDRDAIAQAEKPRVKKTNTKRVSFA